VSLDAIRDVIIASPQRALARPRNGISVTSGLLSSDAPTRWTVVGASDSREVCEQGAADKRQAPWNQPKDGSTMLVRFVCLPDTLDPHGPKGK
jgi:hypothetical protein